MTNQPTLKTLNPPPPPINTPKKPTTTTPNQHEQLKKLREPFPQNVIRQRPGFSGGKPIDYVNHATVTGRLLDVDPTWTWTPMATTPEGAPIYERNKQGEPIGLWINLTICGITRPGYGAVSGRIDNNTPKQLISDAIKNAAMRAGVALDLWGDLEEETQ